ncbi:MAG: hypothetical protein HC905_25110 [Bacteroidales bacterium]|nr:hypothetical protein [Bacteroidales bacterium]
MMRVLMYVPDATVLGVSMCVIHTQYLIHKGILSLITKISGFLVITCTVIMDGSNVLVVKHTKDEIKISNMKRREFLSTAPTIAIATKSVLQHSTDTSPLTT